jgi:Secretion system C-terminal sorting domain
MKKTINTFGLIAITMALSHQAQAQTCFNVASNSFTTTDGNQYAYSIGEMVAISTQQNPNIMVTQGFLQPTTTLLAAAPNHGKTQIGSDIKVYPNPTENFLFVELDMPSEAILELVLRDALGKTIYVRKENTLIGINKLKLDLTAYAAGTYFLFITNPSDTQQAINYSFKIQKLN